MVSSKKPLYFEVELKPNRKVPVRTRSLPQTILLCALCGGDVYVCSCVRTGNGSPAGLEEKWSHRVKRRERWKRQREQENTQKAASLISSEICVCFDDRLLYILGSTWIHISSADEGIALTGFLCFWHVSHQCVQPAQRTQGFFLESQVAPGKRFDNSLFLFNNRVDFSG